MGNDQDRNGNYRAGEMDGIGFLGQNHAGYSHARIPEILQRARSP